MSKLLRYNGATWKCRELGESALLLEPKSDISALQHIHLLTKALEEAKWAGITDVVPAYQSVAVIFDRTTWTHQKVIEALQKLPDSISKKESKNIFEITVDYTEGLDWERVESHTGLSKSEIIERHTKPVYTVAMIGFLPGFIFLEGLDQTLSTPRMANPRTSIPAGSVGIGGTQTGLYSLESPGGWNIIGYTAQRFFDLDKNPPINLKAGDFIRFVEVTGRYNG